MDKLELVLCDIDGTLVAADTNLKNANRDLSPRTKKVIEALHANGVYFGIASGRPVDEVERTRKLWGFDFPFEIMIGLNGSELYDGITDTKENYFLLKREWIKEILALMKPFDTAAFMYKGHDIYANKINQRMEISAKSSNKEIVLAMSDEEMASEENAKIMFRMEEGMMDEIEAYVNAHPSPYYQGVKTQSTLMEFMDKRVSKGYALEKFCLHHDIDLAHVASFGDTSNDNSMLIVSGLGVCMANGSDDTKAIADVITELDDHEDGFADFMEKHFSNYLK